MNMQFIVLSEWFRFVFPNSPKFQQIVQPLCYASVIHQCRYVQFFLISLVYLPTLKCRYLPNSYFISKKIINDNVFISNTHEGIELRDLSLTLKDYAIVHFLCKLRGIGWIRNLKSRGYVSQCIDVMYCFNSIQNLIPCSCFHMGSMVSDSESILAVNWL